jgi:hypothetical protein
MTLHSDHGFTHWSPTRAQRSMSLRLGPQVQALLSGEGRSRGGSGARQGGGSSDCRSSVGGNSIGADAAAEASDASALEGDDVARLRAENADAPEGRRQLKDAARGPLRQSRIRHLPFVGRV